MAFPLQVSEVHNSVTVVMILLFVVQMCALVMNMKDLNQLVVAIACSSVVPLVVLVGMVVDT